MNDRLPLHRSVFASGCEITIRKMVPSPSRVRSRRRRYLSLLPALSTLLLAAGASHAWACVPQPLLFLEPRSSGPVGSEIVVRGINFGPGQTEVRWSGPQGILLATGPGGQISIPISIPASEPGLYLLTVITRDGVGAIDTSAVSSFEVLPDNARNAEQGQAAPPVAPPESRTRPPSEETNGSGMPLSVAGLGMLGGVVGGTALLALTGARSRHAARRAL